MTPTIRHIPADYLIPHQWWDGPVYLAGFPTRDGALWYGRLHGWITAADRS
jgi:hypothetical protein